MKYLCVHIAFKTCPLLYFSGLSIAQEPYLGTFMGTLSNKDQGISGQVYCVDENTVYLKNFTFSGTGSGSTYILFPPTTY